MVYYMTDALFDTAQKSTVTAFKPGFRMLVGDSTFRTKEETRKWRQLTYICMQDAGTRAPETIHFPTKPCAYGIMANHRLVNPISCSRKLITAICQTFDNIK